MNQWRILTGDVREKLSELPAGCVRTCVTSPPYFGLRDYGVKGQLGLEPTPEAYVAAMVSVFAEVRRVLSDDGTLWLNLGDSYAASGRGGNPDDSPHQKQATNRGSRQFFHKDAVEAGAIARKWVKPPAGYKQKDLIGIPWMVAFALRADGWYLRSDIIWSKPNPMPESVTDRPTKAHEYIFLLSKSQRYFYDAAAIAEPVSGAMLAQMEQGYDGEGTKDYESAGVQNPSSVKARIITNARARVTGRGVNKERDKQPQGRQPQRSNSGGFPLKGDTSPRNDWNSWNSNDGRGFPFDGVTRNKRTVWNIATHPYPDAHFATFPEKLIEPCILAGSAFGDTVLDPFTGSGTTGAVAIRHQRNFIGVELNPAYVQLARKRIGDVAPMFAQEVA